MAKGNLKRLDPQPKSITQSRTAQWSWGTAALVLIAALVALDVEYVVSVVCAFGDLFGAYNCANAVVAETVARKVSAFLLLAAFINVLIIVPLFRAGAKVQASFRPGK